METQSRTRTRSIQIPATLETFRNLKNAKRFAIDIGGSLTKIAYYSTTSHRKVLYGNESGESKSNSKMTSTSYEVSQGARLHFIKFETKYIESCLDFIQQHLTNRREKMVGKSIKATGGGAYKYSNLIQEKLGLMVDKENEIDCLIKGCNFLLKNIPNEAFMYHRHAEPQYVFQSADPNVFPYLLVNIGSGVSIMKVESDDSYERIGGTATGGGTFWGLGSLLTSAKGFDELLELAEKGDHRNVDMLVRDIFGGDLNSLGLSGDIIASAFGKAMNANQQTTDEKNFSEADLARSLLVTISNDIGQIACLYAMMHKLNKVYFGGYFLRNHPLSMHTLTFSIKYWSRDQVQSLFLRHEGYLGAIGAFLKGTEEWDTEKYSWLENYAGSSGLNEVIPISAISGIPVSQLEMDRWEATVSFCPLLANPAAYIPDTVNLTEDHEAREYWLDCFEGSVDKYASRAVKSQPDSATAKQRGEFFKEKFVSRLRELREQPFAYGSLSVRSLLDTIEHCLKELDFPDPYLKQKQIENETAMSQLAGRLEVLDGLKGRKLHEELVTSVLAGNMFDWGAQESAKLMEKGTFGFQEAVAEIQPRPWLVDGLDKWLDRMERGPQRCAAIFVDNSGVDIVLGVLPLARELLRRGSRVLLCCNSAPALNDVTHHEMVALLRQASAICPIIRESVSSGQLTAMPTGQTGPCLDLSRLNSDLVCAMRDVDLLILEGMGRALHTNLEAKFNCECLKLAVIKNRWLAQRLGGGMFSVLCQYEPWNQVFRETPIYSASKEVEKLLNNHSKAVVCGLK